MTPQQKIKHLILLKLEQLDADFFCSKDINADNIDEIYNIVDDEHYLQDPIEEIRCGEVETTLDCPYSRYYESKSVAAQYVDGSWVGWVYWYGGGKHSEPQAVEWQDDAYAVNCVSEEKLVIVNTFTRE